MISTAQLQVIFPHAGARIGDFAQPLNDAMQAFGIATARQAAAFLAECAHESGELRYLRELADGSAYEGRLDLGNTEPGDGPRYKGGGLIQITGRYNYEKCGIAIGVDLVDSPELIATPRNACFASAWWWSAHGLNQLADVNAFWSISRRINGGDNGMDSRCAYWAVALKAVGA